MAKTKKLLKLPKNHAVLPANAGKASRNKHDLCDIANWLTKIGAEVSGTGMSNLQASAVHLQKFSKRLKEIAQLV